MNLLKRDRIWVRYFEGDTIKYICTSKEGDRSTYFLYKVDGEKIERIAKSENPIDFDEIIYKISNITTGQS